MTTAEHAPTRAPRTQRARDFGVPTSRTLPPLLLHHLVDPVIAPHIYGETVSDSYRTLLLLRHAKSDYPPEVADHDRPLAPRGIREAALAGDWLRAHAPAVDAVLCSTATRTRETLERTRIDAPTEFVDGLYDATPGAVIDEINGVSSRFDCDVATLLVIGHEPTMSALALGLATADGSNSAAAERISTKFPTSAIAVLRTGEDVESARAEQRHVGHLSRAPIVPAPAQARVASVSSISLSAIAQASMPGLCGLTHHPTTPAASLATPQAPFGSFGRITMDSMPATDLLSTW